MKTYTKEFTIHIATRILEWRGTDEEITAEEAAQTLHEKSGYEFSNSIICAIEEMIDEIRLMRSRRIVFIKNQQFIIKNKT